MAVNKEFDIWLPISVSLKLLVRKGSFTLPSKTEVNLAMLLDGAFAD